MKELFRTVGTFLSNPIVLAIAAIAMSALGIIWSWPLVQGGIPALFDGFLGALLGAVVSIFVLRTSIRGIENQIKQQAHENDKSRERLALAACITELWKLRAQFDAGNFPAPGRADSTFDALCSRLSELRLQMLEEDPRLMAALRVWQEVLQENRNSFWRLRNGTQAAPSKFVVANDLTGMGSLLDFLATQLAAYGRANVKDRDAIVEYIAASASDAAHHPGEWYSSYVTEDAHYRYWPFNVMRPPLG